LKPADARTFGWLPLGRQYKPLGCDQNGYYHYELFDRLAWQFTYDPREIEGGSRVIQGDWVYLYKDGKTGRVADLQNYLERVVRLIAAGAGENAIIYAGRLLGTLRKK
jgi:hypothetical protein